MKIETVNVGSRDIATAKRQNKTGYVNCNRDREIVIDQVIEGDYIVIPTRKFSSEVELDLSIEKTVQEALRNNPGMSRDELIVKKIIRGDEVGIIVLA